MKMGYPKLMGYPTPTGYQSCLLKQKGSLMLMGFSIGLQMKMG